MTKSEQRAAVQLSEEFIRRTCRKWLDEHPVWTEADQKAWDKKCEGILKRHRNGSMRHDK